jgi:hypothetical protein
MITLLAALLLVWTASQGLIQTQRLAPQLIASLHGVDHPLRGDSQNDDCLKLPDGIGGLHKAMALLPAFRLEPPPRILGAPPLFHARFSLAPKISTAPARAPPRHA